MPNIQMHLVQKGDVSFKETQIAFWRISLSIKEEERKHGNDFAPQCCGTLDYLTTVD